jgi:hypothetical protein
MVKKRTRHKYYRAKKRRHRTRRRGGFKCVGFGCLHKSSVAPILAPPPVAAAAVAAVPVVVENPMLRLPDPVYLVVGGKRDTYNFKGSFDTRTFYSNPAYYILDKGEPITEERSRYITADFTDNTQMEGIATKYSARFDIIIFDWAVAENFHDFNLFREITPFFIRMLKRGGKLVLDPSFNPKMDSGMDPATLLSSMNIKTYLIERLAGPSTYPVLRDVITEVYIKNKMYRELASTIANEKFVTFHNTSPCYIISKTA